ncbi:SMODS domain-containing nucleotidyltransferase [Thiomicrorhabdus cannonii]|uniref:SMODS domain-containing nucleotidyltransferase n=1 Tax=Thiomicrorhabdus cannonii TaxID=2748011 RepID=UPI0015BD3D65|nr:nucleotidyltransferase [Thiomicrorhabdus cannonii]
MPRDINQGFNDFHNKLKTSAVETEAAKSHRSSIEACLKNNFGLNRFTRIGSFGNGTNINSYSDVDYLACLPTSALTETSTASLVKVKNALDARFPNTGVKVSTPAVVCPFGTYKSEDTEVVVADYRREESGFKVYEIADGNNSWMEVSPDAHNHYVSTVDKKHGGKVKPLIRFIKAWKYYRDVPIKSFYLEMRVAKYADDESSIVYDIDVKNILAMLRDNELAAMQDPMGVAGYVYPCKSDTLKQDALSKLKTAATRAEKARESEANGDTKTAFDWWRLLYNDNFPTYYL